MTKSNMAKANVVFVCVENAGRSQMAEGFAKRFGKDHIEAWSTGSKPSGKINETAIEVMNEHGIDISAYRSKGLSDLPDVKWDYVVTMGCGDACPFVPSKGRSDWDIPDPKGRTKEDVRNICRQIEDQVIELIHRAITEGYGRDK